MINAARGSVRPGAPTLMTIGWISTWSPHERGTDADKDDAKASLHPLEGARRRSTRSEEVVVDREKFAQLRESGVKKRAGV
jgi:hypothetical protein